MNKFNVGDVVKCIDDADITLTVGKTYTVRDITESGNAIKTVELSGWFNSYLFTLVEDEPVALAHDAVALAHDPVHKPSHYNLMGIEVITIIARLMTEEQFYGYCLGNTLKYRLRAGKKDKVEQDINKALEYEMLFENNKHLCKQQGEEDGKENNG